MDGLSAGAGKGPLGIERALALIAQGFNRKLTVAEMARYGGLSPFHFSRIFRSAIGQSPHEYLTARRIAAAMTLLEQTALTAGEIGKQIGYSRQAHFTQAFRQKTGFTPGAYRLRRQAVHRLDERTQVTAPCE